MDVIRKRLWGVGLACIAMAVGGCSSDEAVTDSDASMDSSLPSDDGAPGTDTGVLPPPADGGAESGFVDMDTGVDATPGTGNDANDADGESQEPDANQGGASDANVGDGDAGDGGPGSDAAPDATASDAGIPDGGAVAAGRCAPPDSPPPHDGGAPPGGPCTSDNDCAFFEWCERPLGSCTGAGTCVWRTAQSQHYFTGTPICGCNGKTYLNYADALSAFTNATFGACPDAFPCNSNADCCPSGGDAGFYNESFCLKPDGQCGGQGICVVPSGQGASPPGTPPVCPCKPLPPDLSSPPYDRAFVYGLEWNVGANSEYIPDAGYTCDFDY